MLATSTQDDALVCSNQKTVSRLFEIQAADRPDATAVSFETHWLTFAELNSRANRIASYLRKAGVERETRVAICLDRGAQIIEAVLGVLKSGGAFVPLDPSYPHDRLSYMLEDSLAAVLITDSRYAASLPRTFAQVLMLDTDWPQIENEPDYNLPDVVLPANAAYVIYTSGSTGKPKGAIVTHEGLYNLALALPPVLQIPAGCPVLQFASFSFDAAVSDWVMSLLVGARLVLASRQSLLPGADLVDVLTRYEIGAALIPPSALAVLPKVELPALRTLIVGGEACPEKVLIQWSPGRRMLNAYGPTEATVIATVSEPLRPNSVPRMGTAISNVQVYVLDAEMQPVTDGISGELFIGGVGLARGYAGQPALTATSFVPDPFSLAAGQRLYRTGDRVRTALKGSLQYLGRMDRQVKLRGFRIELGEIETMLSSHSSVRNCAVELRGDEHGNQQLVAYIVPEHWSALYAQPSKDGYLLPNGMTVAYLNRNETDHIFKEIFERRTYLRHNIELPEDATIIDVGANIGLFLLFVGERCPRARILAFEPIPETFAVLSANAAMTPATVELFNVGLSDCDTELEFASYPEYSGLSGVAAYADPDYRAELVKTPLRNEIHLGTEGAVEIMSRADDLLQSRFTTKIKTLPVRRLSNVLRGNKLEHIDLLKVDVEGSEVEVLRGIDSADWLLVGQVVVEVHDSSGNRSSGRLADVIELLEREGFETVAEQGVLLESSDIYNVYGKRRDRGFRRGGASVTSHLRGDPLDLVPELRSMLQRNLPEHMIPASFVLMRGLPLTSSGKVDRNALPAPMRSTGVAAAPSPRNDTEYYLRQCWSEVLSCPQPSIHDNFFDLGGDSLAAVRLANLLAKDYKSMISVQTIFSHPTIAELAVTLQDKLSADPPVSILAINPAGNRPPLFCVHPSPRRASQYAALARFLGPKQPVYAVQLPLSKVTSSGSVEEIAAQLVHDIRAIQPHGPYSIAGWSLGGMVAWEIACILAGAGEPMGLLALLETSYFLALAGGEVTEQELCLYEAMTAERLKENVASWVNQDNGQVRALLRGASLLEALARRFRPKPYPGHAVLFRTETPDAVRTNAAQYLLMSESSGEDYGWSNFSRSLDIRYLPGSHAAFIDAPNALLLARQLSECLDQSQARV